MKVSKEKLEQLNSKNDEELWIEIQAIAKRHGLTLPNKMPSAEEMQKLRGAMMGIEKISLSDASRIISSYKKKK